MRTIVSIGLVMLSGAALAQTAGTPKLTENDTWTYQDTVENRSGWHQTRVESTVVHAESASVTVSDKLVGSPMPPVEHLHGADWSRSRSVNGHQTVVNRPLSFPLAAGKTWQVEYAEDHPNRVHTSEHWTTKYKVVGWEDVTVPAGTFHALKIEGEGEWSAAMAPAIGIASGSRVDAQGATTIMQSNRVAPTTASGRTYKAFWYVPAVKRWVKSDEEYFDSNNTRTERFVNELVAYKVAE